MEGSMIQLNELCHYDPSGEIDEDGNLTATIQPTGLRPTFEAKLKAQGVDFGSEMFGETGMPVGSNGARRGGPGPSSPASPPPC
jgi:hypothetical protein